MNASPTRITVHSPTDILDIVPTLLGFIPTESLVVIYLDTVNGRTQIATTARIDLPTHAEELTATLHLVEYHATKHDQMILIAYSVDTTAADNTLRFLLDSRNIDIKVAISAAADGWAELGVGGSGHRQPYRDASSQVTTAIVAAGLQRPAWTREDLGESVSPPQPVDAARFASLLTASEPMSCEEMTGWLRRWAGDEPGRSIDLLDAAALVASVQKVVVRDCAWAAITCADSDRHIDLWRQICRLVDGPPSHPVLGLLGMASWIGGQGALANVVLDRAAHTDGCDAYTLFDLLRTVLEAGVDPRQWDSIREAISVNPSV